MFENSTLHTGHDLKRVETLLTRSNVELVPMQNMDANFTFNSLAYHHVHLPGYLHFFFTSTIQ